MKNSTYDGVVTWIDLAENYQKFHYGCRTWGGGGGGARGQVGGTPGEKGAGVVREAGEEGAGRGRKREKLRDIAQYFAIPKMQRGRSQQIPGGNLD